MNRPKSIIFISGNGSNLQNIINNVTNNFLKMDIVAVVSNNAEAKGLVRAKEAGIETIVIDTAINSNKYLSCRSCFTCWVYEDITKRFYR
jgi:folate-dependent phosphoribosylglycinamide formyltransferase PurN